MDRAETDRRRGEAALSARTAMASPPWHTPSLRPVLGRADARAAGPGASGRSVRESLPRESLPWLLAIAADGILASLE